MTAGTFDVEEYRGLLRSAEARLDAVDQALVRLDEGTYGTCATCGEPIGDDRLDGDPTARRCARHDEADPGASGAWAAPPAGG